MKLKLLALGLMLGAAVATTSPEVPVLAQAGPTATPTRVAGTPGATGTGTPTTAITPVSRTAPAAGSDAVAQPAPTRPPAPPTPRPGTTTTTPRAGGFPVGLAIPLLAGGAAALGGGVYLLRRGRRK